MSETFEIKKVVVGPVQTNCYILKNNKTNEILVIDPGDQPKRIASVVKEMGGNPVAILLTHGHFDHVMALKELSETWNIKSYAHEKEEETLTKQEYNLCKMIGAKAVFSADCYVKDHEILNLAGFQIKVLPTPGHTVGGVCYYFEEEKILFSGDTMFQESVGRTDFPKGSMSTLVRSIKTELMVLPDDVKVYPGHMESTTIGYERQYNPYL